MRKVVFLMAWIAALILIGADAVIFESGKSNYVVVKPDREVPGTEFAVKELQQFLTRGTGFNFAVVSEKDWNGKTPAIIVGPTRYTQEKGIESAKLQMEEWLIQAMPDGNLVITGGYPRGVLYAVYEFLEHFGGCRFPAVNVEYVPKLTKLTVPDRTRINGQPFFKLRDYTFGISTREYNLFFLRNRMNGRGGGPELGFAERAGNPRIHTFWRYSQDFPADKPEYFALNAEGKRLRATSGMGPGQVCMTHPEVRKLFAAKLRQFIREERAQIDRVGNGEPYPVIYDISANDNPNKCVCSNCLAQEKQYGAYSGVLLEFINSVADDIKADYPEIILQTMAYIFTEKPPVGIKAHPNVMMQIAYLGTEFSVGQRDTLRPLSHPNNAESRRLMEEWSKAAGRLSIWDYWVIYRERFVSPYTLITGQQNIFRTYAKCGVERIFIESELDDLEGRKRPEISSFLDLKHYLGAKLMLNPEADVPAVIDDFMRFYYGAAAGPMRQYLNYLEKRMEEEKRPLGRTPIASRSYLDAELFRTADRLLTEAERAVTGNRELEDRVLQERLPLDLTFLNMRDRLEIPEFNPEKIAARLETAEMKAIEKYSKPENWAGMKKTEKQRIELLRNPIPLPEELAGRKVYDFFWATMGKPNNVFADDPEACGGKAVKLSTHPKHPDSAVFHGQLMQFGIYDPAEKKNLIKKYIPLKEVPADEKFHLYHIGKTKLTEKCYLWAHWSWLIQQSEPQLVYSKLDPDAVYDVYVSVKLTGPAYVAGSREKNTLLLDRLIFAEAR